MNIQAFSIENGRYQIIGKLGEGGMAAVFRAYDTLLKVERAIKVLSPEYAKHGQIRERFVTEASTMARLHHKNIVMVHDIKPQGTPVYMVMEMLKGGSLMDRVEDHGTLHAQQAIDATIAMVEGLGFAHKNKVIHRDVKPHNVLLDEDGIPKVTDFGIARIEDENSGKTKTGAIMGTFAYMAPEQRLSARRATAQSDLYAAGASMFVLMTNQNPAEIFSEEVQDRLMEGFDPEVKAFIRKACHFNAKERYADSEEMADALRLLKTKIEPLPKDAMPVYAEGSELRPMKDLSDNEISVVQEQWHTFCHTTPPSGQSRPPLQAPNSSSVETMAFGGMDEEDGTNKTMGFDYLENDNNAAQTITAQGVAAETIMPMKGGNETAIQSSDQSAAYPVNQVPMASAAPKSKLPLILGIIGFAALAGGGFVVFQDRMAKEAELQKEIAEKDAQQRAEKQKAEEERKAREEQERLAALQTDLSKKTPAVEGTNQKTILQVLGAPTWVITDKDNNSDWTLSEGSELSWLWKNQNCPPIQIEFKLDSLKEAYQITQINDGWENGESGCLEEGDYPSSKLPPDTFLCNANGRSKQCKEYTKPKKSSATSSSNASSSSSSSSGSSGSACNTSAIGRLKVNSRPWSYVYLDGQKIGTKIDQETKACGHRIRMTRDGVGSKSLSLTVREGQTTTYCWDFEKESQCDR